MVLGYKFVRFPFLYFIPLALTTSPLPPLATKFLFILISCVWFLLLVALQVTTLRDFRRKWHGRCFTHTATHTHPDRHTHTHPLAHAAQHNCTHNLATAKCVLNVSHPQPPPVDSHSANPSPIQFAVFNKLGAMFSVAICHFVVFI